MSIYRHAVTKPSAQSDCKVARYVGESGDSGDNGPRPHAPIAKSWHVHTCGTTPLSYESVGDGNNRALTSYPQEGTAAKDFSVVFSLQESLEAGPKSLTSDSRRGPPPHAVGCETSSPLWLHPLPPSSGGDVRGTPRVGYRPACPWVPAAELHARMTDRKVRMLSMRVWLYVCNYTYIQIHVPVCVCVHIPLNVECAYICLYIYVCVFIYLHTRTPLAKTQEQKATCWP